MSSDRPPKVRTRRLEGFELQRELEGLPPAPLPATGEDGTVFLLPSELAARELESSDRTPDAPTRPFPSGVELTTEAARPPSSALSKSSRYKVRGEIGSGGMGKILRVEDVDLNREIAMKILLPRAEKAAIDSDEARTRSQRATVRFIEEAQITSQLEHPGVLPVHDFGVNADGEVFFTMQYVRGKDTLEEVIERLRAGDPKAFEEFTFERRVQIVQQVCHALQYAHDRGVIHRDVKPSNVMLGDHGEVYLFDWGLAKLIEESDDERRPAVKTLRQAPPTELLEQLGDRDRAAGFLRTEVGAMVGTPAYMAPEQVLGDEELLGPATDVYSLTAVLYEFLTLHWYLGHLGDSESLGGLIRAVLNLRPLDAETHWDPLNKRVPRPLSRICRRGLRKPPGERYSSPRALAEALQLWLEGRFPIVCPGTAMQRGLAAWSRWIDDYPVAGPFVIYTSATLVGAWFVTATVLALS